MGIRRRRRREVIGKCSSFRCNACTAVVSASAAAVVAVELNFAIKIWPPEQNWAGMGSTIMAVLITIIIISGIINVVVVLVFCGCEIM